jgi:hypothetical protein
VFKLRTPYSAQIVAFGKPQEAAKDTSQTSNGDYAVRREREVPLVPKTSLELSTLVSKVGWIGYP